MNCLRFAIVFAILPVVAAAAADTVPPIKRLLPPEGIEIPADVRSRLEERLSETKQRLGQVRGDLQRFKPDVEVFTKAVDLALLHGEFYRPQDFAKADWALDIANERLDALAKGEAPWTKATGLVVRGYRSSIDDSAQPYGLVIPEGHDFSKPCPLYVWLHGRGDKNTDLHFLQERATKAGQIAPANAIVVHPFGRHCVGWKHAGEIDVLEAWGSVQSRYQIELDHMVLIGFSMGGAGAWHIGAHYTNCWDAIAPGAGFAETARYQRLTPDRYPPWYEQKLWGLYDVPNYVRNLFNTDVIAYSGELDRQIQAARVMEEAYKAEGRELTHLIGPGVEHKYEPGTLKELLNRLEDGVARERVTTPKSVHVQTRTLRYPHVSWVEILQLGEHWDDARVNALIVGPEQVQVTTKNVQSLVLRPFPKMAGTKITLDGIELVAGQQSPPNDATFVREGNDWRQQPDHSKQLRTRLAKRHQLQGPIDDAFLNRFLVVVPTGKSSNERFQQWVDFELQHFENRWRALMRAELPMKRDVDVRDEDLEQNVILFGDSESNAVLARLNDELPVRFANGEWTLGGQSYPAERFVPALIFPRKSRYGEFRNYVVLNSGLTFREGHDRTNSLQNPKLPDWAIIDIRQPPDAHSPGRIHDAGFFDEQWQLKQPPKAP